MQEPEKERNCSVVTSTEVKHSLHVCVTVKEPTGGTPSRGVQSEQQESVTEKTGGQSLHGMIGGVNQVMAGSPHDNLKSV